MRVSARLSAVLLFAVLGTLALVFAGLLDWIVGVLFLLMEFLGQSIRSFFFRPKEKRHRPSSGTSKHGVTRRWGVVHRKGRPRRRRPALRGNDPASGHPAQPSFRVLVPLSSDDTELIEFALEECRIRQAELILLFLRPMAVTPMGPNPFSGLLEDEEARGTFNRVALEADRNGVPLRTLYEVTSDRALTIGEAARSTEADVVIVGSARKSGVARFLSRDPNPSILKLLPEHASLMIHGV